MDIEKKLNELIELVRAWIQREEADGCDDCKYLPVRPWDPPCNKCKRNQSDYYEYKEWSNAYREI